MSERQLTASFHRRRYLADTVAIWAAAEKPRNASASAEALAKAGRAVHYARPMREVAGINAPSTDTAASPRALGLRAFAFEVATFDENGRQTQRRRAHAQQFGEDLGNGTILEMVQIPGGSFLMGAPESETGSLPAERPQHRVTVPGFFLGKHAVTIEQWLALMGALPPRMQTLDAAFMASGRQPVVRVSWDDADGFCTQLSRIAGRDYRLPSEAEWEYACRAGTTGPFAFGETITPEVANYDGEPSGAVAAAGNRATMPIGSLGFANGFGLFEMHGNVWEWCQDIWHSDYNGAPTDGSAWRVGGDERTRMLRGGAWAAAAHFCRAAARSLAGEPSVRSRKIGFRVAMTAAAP
jgi:formylglycine-generating enzyme required for sulfatase activity